MYKTIVHPTDFSDASIPALQTAHELAKQFGSKLLICFVARSPMIAAGNSLTDPKTNETRDIAAELESIQAPDSAVDMELRIVIAEKSTRVKSMLKFLEEMDCDLLVMGMHKRAGVAGWLGSSITEEVVRRAGCAVLVVKQHGHDYPFEDSEQPASIDADSAIWSEEQTFGWFAWRLDLDACPSLQALAYALGHARAKIAPLYFDGWLAQMSHDDNPLRDLDRPLLYTAITHDPSARTRGCGAYTFQFFSREETEN